MNELSILFHKLDIDTNEVLNAASTKWNFIKYLPGLVGGHCIGVDPYYLSYKSNKLGFRPKIILAGRKLNNQMSDFIFTNMKLELKKLNKNINNSKVLVLGATFKENCADLEKFKSF